ncbi:hypothetical protein [Pseudonocardia adelaidensis]|uniref:Uncharacterized protein n=1 Tax=Pseudonocardia adelaidensis TaxID=648754 RepID=A0ABP9P084_9PSEU
MRTSTPDRLTAATIEQLLDGGSGPAGLTLLLAAAAGPGTASELAGEAAAVAAFVDAPRTNPLPSAPVRRPSMLSTALSKILAAKALAAVVLLAGAGGGVALAANASHAPSSPTDETSATSGTTADPEPAADDADPAPGSHGSAAGGPGSTSGPSPEPSIAGLCTAWAAGATDNPGKAAANPAFRSLVEAAGSEEDVAGFCSGQEGTDPPGRSATAPGHTGDALHDADDADDEAAGEPGSRGTPPTAAPGKPDHPAGRATRSGAVEDADHSDDDSDDDEGSEDGSRGGNDHAEEARQGGGASGDRRPAG